MTVAKLKGDVEEDAGADDFGNYEGDDVGDIGVEELGALKTWNTIDGSGPGPPLAAVLCQAVIRQLISKAMNSLFKENSGLGYSMLAAGSQMSGQTSCI